MSKVVEVNNGSFIRHFTIFCIVILVIVCSAVVAFDFTSENQGTGMAVFGLAILVAVLYPISAVLDDSFTGNSSLISEYNELAKKDSNPKITLSHPRKYLVIILTLLSPFSVGILWIIAFFLAIGKFTVLLPDDKTALLKKYPAVWDKIN